MNIEDIKSEKDIYLFIGARFEWFKDFLNKIFKTMGLQFYGSEVRLRGEYFRRGYYTGGGYVDLMYVNEEMVIPIELKYTGDVHGYGQLEKYMELIKKSTKRKVCGVLICKKATKSLKEVDDGNIMFIELETGRCW